MKSLDGSKAASSQSPMRRRTIVLSLFVLVAACFLYSRFWNSKKPAEVPPSPKSVNKAGESFSADAADYHANADQIPNPYAKGSQWAGDSGVTNSAGGEQEEVSIDGFGIGASRGENQQTGDAK